MRAMIKGAKFAGLTTAMALMMSATAHAGALYEPSMKDPEPARRCSLSANVALTTDYVFRGFSQTDEGAAIQGGFDADCGMFYAGVWASNLDFGGAESFAGSGRFRDVADIEIDTYAGIKATIPGTPVEMDLGVIYYAYPQAFDTGAELDYVEIKLGASATLVPDLLTAGLTVYYSPDYTLEAGENWVFEGTAEITLPQVAIFSPSISGTVGYQEGDESNTPTAGFDYWYYNAGLTLGFHEKFSLDIRYWGTDDIAGCSTATTFQCDERVVGTFSASF